MRTMDSHPFNVEPLEILKNVPIANSMASFEIASHIAYTGHGLCKTQQK